jgi:hypothetical protein
VQYISDLQRRHRLGIRHHLARPAGDLVEVAAALVGLHSSDPTSVYLSARARLDLFAVADLEHLLYDSRRLVRVVGMRKTLWVVPVAWGATITKLYADRNSAPERRRLDRILREQGITADPDHWLDRVLESILDHLIEDGPLLGAELSARVPELKIQLGYGAGTAATTVGLGTRALFLLAAGGRVVRARPAGSWISGTYRWADTESWTGGRLIDERSVDECRRMLIEAWLHTYGPGTVEDIAWWSGLPKNQVRATLDTIGAVEVQLEEGFGWVAPGDEGTGPSPPPWVALLPSLDPSAMGWKGRAFYLGDHGPQVFDRNGNAGATVWVDGRVVGAWGQTPSGSIAIRFLEEVGAEMMAAVHAQADLLERWLGPIRFRPRFAAEADRSLQRGG